VLGLPVNAYALIKTLFRSRGRVFSCLLLGATVLSLAAWLGLSGQAAAGQGSAYDYSFTSIDGAELPLTTYRGKVLLVVNTASECGFTKQYADLQKLYDTYRTRGLVVLGVPSNDFGGQEPASESEIKKFCEVNFDVDFPLTTKNVVSGEGAHPFYQWAGAQAGMLGRPKWNFHKYLIGPDGQFVDWFSSTTNPMSETIIQKIEPLLPTATISVNP